MIDKKKRKLELNILSISTFKFKKSKKYYLLIILITKKDFNKKRRY